jgi:hypothetical protein
MFWARGLSAGGMVVVEVDIENPMAAVLDAPMARTASAASCAVRAVEEM